LPADIFVKKNLGCLSVEKEKPLRD